MMKVPVSIAGNEIEDEPVKKTRESRVDLLLVSFFFLPKLPILIFLSSSLPPPLPPRPSPTSKNIHNIKRSTIKSKDTHHMPTNIQRWLLVYEQNTHKHTTSQDCYPWAFKLLMCAGVELKGSKLLFGLLISYPLWLLQYLMCMMLAILCDRNRPANGIVVILQKSITNLRKQW